MGWLGDNVVLGQKPRENGCICAYALIPIGLGAAGAIVAALKAAQKIHEVVS